MEINKELIEQAKKAASVDEIKTIAKENDLEISDEEAKTVFERFHTSGEISDEELDNVAGGKCVPESSGMTPKYKVGDEVIYVNCPVVPLTVVKVDPTRYECTVWFHKVYFFKYYCRGYGATLNWYEEDYLSPAQK